MQVQQLMTRTVKTIGRLLVLDREQAPVGILSLGDIGKHESAASEGARALQGTSEPHREPSAQRRSKP